MRRVTAVTVPVAHLIGPGKLKVVNGHLAFSAEGQGALRLDPAELRLVLCYGRVGASDAALELLFRADVHVAWLTAAGTRCLGWLARANLSATTIRLLQYRAFAGAAGRLEWARQVVAAKIDSQALAARHYQRHGGSAAGDALALLQGARARCDAAATVEEVRGLEGAASAAWFAALGGLLAAPWQFPRRSRRPPADPVNALLSLGYTWLLTRARARCDACGLEVYLGGLHEYRPGRPSLACDLIEPLRVPAVDRWALQAFNGGRLAPDDFRAVEGGIHLQPSAFARMVQSWEEHWLGEGHEQALDAWVLGLLAWLRRLEAPAGIDPGEDTDL